MDKEIIDLKTITDFDLGVGGSPEDFIRLGEVSIDVSMPEINLIAWILLEQEFSKVKDKDKNAFAQCAGAGGGDSIDAGLGYRDDWAPAARKYSEKLLRAVGVSLPFELLSGQERKGLFRLFSSQSNLLKQEKYGSIPDLYEGLRRRSKFREEFDVLEMLGRGEFGVVHSVQTKQPEEERILSALKQITIKSFNALDSFRMVLNESKILQKLGQHPNIVSYRDAWLEVHEDADDKERLVPVFFLQMELGYLALSRWKEESPQPNLSVSLLLKITLELLSGVEWIHAKNCLHLDINPKNILWADSACQSIKIVDFGLAASMDDCPPGAWTTLERRGTVPYCAPENSLNAKSDVYSLGVTLFEISQNLPTRSELMKRLEIRDLHTGYAFLDNVLPLMLRKQNQRPTPAEVLGMLSQE